MVTNVKSIRSSVKWAGIAAACLATLPLVTKDYKNFPDWVVQQSDIPNYDDKDYLYKLFFQMRQTPQEEIDDALSNPASSNVQKIEEKILNNPYYTMGFLYWERDYARSHLNSRLTFILVSHKNWDLWKGTVCPTDLELARKNPDSLFALALTPKEEYPIGLPDLKILKEQPDSPFSIGLRKHPGLKEAIKKFGLEEDPYFATFLD